jgi:UDP-glucose 4-epimerase
MRIIITGSAGYVGTQLAQELKDHELLLADKKTGIDITQDFYEKYKSFKPDIIYHLAAQVDIQKAKTYPELFMRDNILATIEVCKFDAKIIFNSSGSVYGDTDIIPTPETVKKDPQNIYAITKSISEEFIQTKKDYVIFRIANIFGGVGGNGIFEKFKNGATIFGDGTDTRDYVHLDDIINALVKAQDWKSGIYNIATGIETSVNQVVDLIGVKKKYLPAVKAQKRSCLNINKALKAGWKPLIHLK